MLTAQLAEQQERVEISGDKITQVREQVSNRVTERKSMTKGESQSPYDREKERVSYLMLLDETLKTHAFFDYFF